MWDCCLCRWGAWAFLDRLIRACRVLDSDYVDANAQIATVADRTDIVVAATSVRIQLASVAAAACNSHVYGADRSTLSVARWTVPCLFSLCNRSQSTFVSRGAWHLLPENDTLCTIEEDCAWTYGGPHHMSAIWTAHLVCQLFDRTSK